MLTKLFTISIMQKTLQSVINLNSELISYTKAIIILLVSVENFFKTYESMIVAAPNISKRKKIKNGSE